MIAALLRDPDEARVARLPRALSHSRINRYLLCPEQYRLYYIERLRPKIPAATLVFGQIIHQAIASFLTRERDPVSEFNESWNLVRGILLKYPERSSWEKLNTIGEALVTKFLSEELPRLGVIRAVETPFELALLNLDIPLVGFIDLIREKNGHVGIVDFKTAASTYKPGDAALSDQLTAYQLAVPDATELALCVLVKTKKPTIEWHVTTRTDQQLGEYLDKAAYVAQSIARSRFYTRPGMWCAWCDYRPVCVGDHATARETLIELTPSEDEGRNGTRV